MNSAPRTKVWVEGRYRKLSRELPQTVFFCPDCKGHPRRRQGCERCEGFGKLTRHSVQELIGWPMGKAFGTRKHKFHGAGREDVDVRMLGDGRPFVFELISPKTRDVDLAAIEAEINSRNAGVIEVLGLHWTEKARVRVLKESPHAKEYEALVAIEGEVDTAAVEEALGKRVVIAQKTPERVAHRRADKVRERWIELRAVEAGEEPNTLRIRIATEHGTYVKEAISGEGGSTEPSIGDLLGGLTCRCVQLDVTAILAEDGGPLEGGFEPDRGATPTFGAGL